MKVAIYSRDLKPSSIPYIKELIGKLRENEIKFCIYDNYFQQLKHILNLDDIAGVLEDGAPIDSSIDYIITLGGDGTILDTVNLMGETNVPIIGINLGRLGFLAGIHKEEISTALEAVVKGNYEIDERTMLELSSTENLFDNKLLALNEFTIQRRESSSMINIDVYINGELLNKYWSDGIIVSTATGSTGYSLSCGGPIIHPGSDNFVITPVASHNLNVRPIVVSSDIVISFEVQGREDIFLCSLDTRTRSFSSSCQLAVKKASFRAKLLRLNDRTFINALKEKLLWGVDQRN